MRLLTTRATRQDYRGRVSTFHISLQEFRPMNHVCWRTAWHGQDIVVFREEEVVDRIHTPDIERVVFVYRTPGETLSDLRYALVQLPDAVAILPLETGFAGAHYPCAW